jgi:DNA repair exonuclease SbcCD ATPase subunit
MLNKIVIINSELYAKASIHIGESASIQITAENNVGKSSFINALNFLYITDKDQMRFEDDRKLSDSMKHYFDGTSLHSFIIFEILKNGYYSILVKATPENNIEYYKITGEYDESCFVESNNGKFKARKWSDVMQLLTLKNPTDVPVKLSNEELYNLVYNSDKNKNPVVWLKKSVKRNGKKSFSNSFTDIYRHLIRTSDINEKSFKNALLVADGQQHFPLNVLSSSSFEKIDEFEKKKTHLRHLTSIKPKFEELKLLNDEFISHESLLGKLKNTFLKKFNKVEQDLSDKINESSNLSVSIRTLQTKVNTTLKNERDELIGQKITKGNNLKATQTENTNLSKELDELKDYEPDAENLLYQGLKNNILEDEKNLTELVSQLSQLERSQFTEKEILKTIKNLENDIDKNKNAITRFDNLLYQNISKDETTIKKAYAFLNRDVAELDKSKIKKEITKSDIPLQFFDSLIDVSDINIEMELPTIKNLQEELLSKEKEFTEKISQLKIVQNRKGVEHKIQSLKVSIKTNSEFTKRIEKKPELRTKIESNKKEAEVLEKHLKEIANKIIDKDSEIEKTKTALTIKIQEINKYRDDLNSFEKQYQEIAETYDIYEIEEVLDTAFENIYDDFQSKYKKFLRIKDNRNNLKNDLNNALKMDVQDIKKFIRDVDEEIINIPQTEKVINNLLDTLSHEIGSPTHSFLTQFNDFKTFVSRSYNQRLAEYPISNIQSVKVKIDDNTDLIADLDKISKLKFSDGLDFDNSYAESREALERQLSSSNGKAINIVDLFKINVEITKVTGKTETIDLSKQVQSRGTNIVLKLYLFLNILKELAHSNLENRVIIYVDELDAIGQKNVKHLIQFCKVNHFVPIFAAPRKVEGIEKYYLIKEPQRDSKNQKKKISFGELQSFPVIYRDAE